MASISRKVEIQERAECPSRGITRMQSSLRDEIQFWLNPIADYMPYVNVKIAEYM